MKTSTNKIIQYTTGMVGITIKVKMLTFYFMKEKIPMLTILHNYPDRHYRKTFLI